MLQSLNSPKADLEQCLAADDKVFMEVSIELHRRLEVVPLLNLEELQPAGKDGQTLHPVLRQTTYGKTPRVTIASLLWPNLPQLLAPHQ
jgi:hypothetical protein